jgi:hypothetical protein
MTFTPIPYVYRLTALRNKITKRVRTSSKNQHLDQHFQLDHTTLHAVQPSEAKEVDRRGDQSGVQGEFESSIKYR